MRTYAVLISLTIVAFLLRFAYLPTHLFFGPEQGKDFLVIRDIVLDHNLTLIGAKTDIEGVFHGPLYYYLAVLPFWVSAGNPLAVSAFFVLIQSLTVVVVYFLTRRVFGGTSVAYIASLFYALSFGSIEYARWLSSQPLTIPLSGLFLLFVLLGIEKNPRYLWIAALFFGFVGQVEFINYAYLFVVAVAVFVFYRATLVRRPWVLCIALFIGALSSIGHYALFDFRHDHLMVKSLLRLFSGETGFSIPLMLAFRDVIVGYAKAADSFIGFPYGIGAVVTFYTAFFAMYAKNRHPQAAIIAIGSLAPFVLVLFRHATLHQLFVFMGLPSIILLSFFLNRMWIRHRVIAGIIFAVVLVFHIYTWAVRIPVSRVFFQSPQPEVRYSDQLALIRRTYVLAGEADFSFQSYTIPYWWQDGWTYLFWYWARINNLRLPVSEKAGQLFVIIQKDHANPEFQKNWYDVIVSGWGEKVFEETFGEFTLERRLVLKQ